MIFSKSKNLEDKLIEMALAGRISVKSIHERLGREEPLSLRAVYKAVDKLIDAGVLLKVGQKVMVDEDWSREVGDKIRSTLILAPSVGERLTYRFTSMEHLDAFWKTSVLPLERAAGVREIFFYNPHNFWAYLPGRQESERAYYRHFKEQGHYGFFVVGGESVADTAFKKQYQDEFLQVDMRDIASFRATDHITVLGSHIITVRLSKQTASLINAQYETGKDISEILPELLRICAHPGALKFSLEHNPRRAQDIKRKLSRNFYFAGIGPKSSG